MIIITIDGPAASGKSTIAKLLAQKLSYFYLNSGYLYRSVACALLKSERSSETEIKNLSKKNFEEIVAKLNYIYRDKEIEVLFENQNITDKLKNPEVADLASKISAKRELREILTVYSRNLANNKNTVAEGRDAGTVVFPKAQKKFFLTAAPEVRALRWQIQQAKLGSKFSLTESLDYVTERDSRDSSRKVAPLKPAENAIIIDNSESNVEQTLKLILSHLK